MQGKCGASIPASKIADKISGRRASDFSLHASPFTHYAFHVGVQFKDYYETLGVDRNATPDEIRKAYRKLARKFHPDLNPNNKQAEAKFKEINEAHEVLSNPENRKKYDALGANWRHGESFQPPPGYEHAYGPGGGSRTYRWSTGDGEDVEFGGTGFSDFFEQFFGGGGFRQAGRGGGGGSPFGGGGGTRYSQRGSDIEGDLMITMEEAFHGGKKNVSLRTTDPKTGETKTETYGVKIPAGVTPGTRIRLGGRGEPGVGQGPAGDLYLRIHIAPDPDFRLEEEGLIYDLDLAPWEAVLGAEVTISVFGRSLKLKMAQGSQNGQKLRIRGQGFPGAGGVQGDLFVVLHIEVPSQLTDEEKKLWEELKKVSKFNPRAR
jgi:curved DNA-binding protein